MINSPEIKPTRPIINSIPIKISLYKLLMAKFSYEVERFLNYDSTILKKHIVDNNAWYIFIISLLDTINS